ncbi:NIPSNAP family protein [Pseudochelatococcus sp. B33]
MALGFYHHGVCPGLAKPEMRIPMIYEMRQYLIDRGRMQDNRARVTRHLPALFEAHGIRAVGRWEVLAGPRFPMYCYLMAWESMAERQTCWGRFYADSEWTRVRAKTNNGSELVQANTQFFLTPRALPPASRATVTGPERIYQMLILRTAIGRAAELSAFLDDTYIPCAETAGANVVGVLDVLSGYEAPSLAILLRWPDIAAWKQGWRRFDEHPAMIGAQADQRAQLGETLLQRADAFIMEPVVGSAPTERL